MARLWPRVRCRSRSAAGHIPRPSHAHLRSGRARHAAHHRHAWQVDRSSVAHGGGLHPTNLWSTALSASSVRVRRPRPASPPLLSHPTCPPKRERTPAQRPTQPNAHSTTMRCTVALHSRLRLRLSLTATPQPYAFVSVFGAVMVTSAHDCQTWADVSQSHRSPRT